MTIDSFTLNGYEYPVDSGLGTRIDKIFDFDDNTYFFSDTVGGNIVFDFGPDRRQIFRMVIRWATAPNAEGDLKVYAPDSFMVSAKEDEANTFVP